MADSLLSLVVSIEVETNRVVLVIALVGIPLLDLENLDPVYRWTNNQLRIIFSKCTGMYFIEARDNKAISGRFRPGYWSI